MQILFRRFTSYDNGGSMVLRHLLSLLAILCVSALDMVSSGQTAALKSSTELIVVGTNGLGWGSGILPAGLNGPSDPVKKEGDGKAPAGIFELSRAFGYATQEQPGWKMPYVSLTPSVECVDDTNSNFYNRVLVRESVSPDWNSSEHMLRSDELYRWGIIVEHNSHPPHAGGGSCIFIHIWRGPGQGTVGCTAMPREQLESILGWLDPTNTPLLVQLPLPVYQSHRKKWKLPALPRSSNR